MWTGRSATRRGKHCSHTDSRPDCYWCEYATHNLVGRLRRQYPWWYIRDVTVYWVRRSYWALRRNPMPRCDCCRARNTSVSLDHYGRWQCGECWFACDGYCNGVPYRKRFG